MKVVSLLPSATEIVYALGLDDSLVGVTAECDHPEAARTKPVISRPAMPLGGLDQQRINDAVTETVAQGNPLYEIDEQLISELQPDLILAQDLCRVCAVPSGDVTEALDKLGCSAEVISLDPNTVEDIISGIDEVGRATGRGERALEVTSSLRERVEAVREKSRPLARSRVLALEWADPPYCGGHWIPEMIDIAGGEETFGEAGRPSKAISWDAVVEASPDVIAYMPCGYGLADALSQARDLFDNASFAATPAARSGRVFAVDASSFFSRPGPRIVDGLEVLAWTVHPEAFPQPPPGRVELVTR